jgi:polyisoprenoid-binding protein YceI
MGPSEIVEVARAASSAIVARMHSSARLLLIGAATVFAACEDPAASSTAAEISAEPQQPAAPAPEGAEHLTIDPARSSLAFTGAKVTASHDGRFDQFSGTVDLDPAAVTASRVEVTIQMSSMQIEPERLRGHLLTADFFDVERFPTATFTSTRIVEGGEGGTHTVTGNLTLHGVTRAITFPANIEVSSGEVRARAEFSINRRDFAIVYPGMPDDLIRDGVVIRFDVRAPRS